MPKQVDIDRRQEESATNLSIMFFVCSVAHTPQPLVSVHVAIHALPKELLRSRLFCLLGWVCMDLSGPEREQPDTVVLRRKRLSGCSDCSYKFDYVEGLFEFGLVWRSLIFRE